MSIALLGILLFVGCVRDGGFHNLCGRGGCRCNRRLGRVPWGVYGCFFGTEHVELKDIDLVVRMKIWIQS